MGRQKPGRQGVTDAELAVLEVLWKRDAVPIRQIVEELYPDARTSSYTTVQKLLERLEAKGCVERDRSSFAHLFRASVAREDLIDQQLAALAEKLCEGSFTPLLTQLVEKRRLTKKEREILRRLLEES